MPCCLLLWRIEMNGAYGAGLPSCRVPKSASGYADKDGRSDTKEKEKKSGPNAFNLEEVNVSILARVGVWRWHTDQSGQCIRGRAIRL